MNSSEPTAPATTAIRPVQRGGLKETEAQRLGAFLPPQVIKLPPTGSECAGCAAPFLGIDVGD